jgi:glycosyltransferase involved in cell wall biosynthesis
MLADRSIAIIQDALPFFGGAERVLLELLRLAPHSRVMALMHNPLAFKDTALEGLEVATSFINRLPGITHNHYRYLPLFPLAIRQFDLSKFDTLISSHYAFANSIKTRTDQLHLSYVHTPMRYMWRQNPDFIRRQFLLTKPFVRLLFGVLRRLDFRAAQQVDQLMTNSAWTAQAIKSAYGREAKVIYPPVQVKRFKPLRRESFYLVVSRLATNKRIDLILAAFAQLDLPLVIVGDGPLRAELLRKASPNVTFMGFRSDPEVADLLGRARAFLHVALEDFGIAAVEAMAAGCPVIALNRGGTAETVVHKQTGLLIEAQTPEALREAVLSFEGSSQQFDPHKIQDHAQQYSPERFREHFLQTLNSALAKKAGQAR